MLVYYTTFYTFKIIVPVRARLLKIIQIYIIKQHNTIQPYKPYKSHIKSN
nr:MAG TPA: hypothetical protein [Caudoviricetes sp.]